MKCTLFPFFYFLSFRMSFRLEGETKTVATREHDILVYLFFLLLLSFLYSQKSENGKRVGEKLNCFFSASFVTSFSSTQREEHSLAKTKKRGREERQFIFDSLPSCPILFSLVVCECSFPVHSPRSLSLVSGKRK